MVDVTDKQEFQKWLSTQSRDVCIAITARAALRIFPVLADEFGRKRAARRASRNNVLPVIRCLVAAYVAAKYPNRINELAAAISDAAFFASSAYRTAISPIAARAASRAANTVENDDVADAAVVAADAVFFAVDATASLINDSDSILNLEVSGSDDVAYIDDGGTVLDLVGLSLWLSGTPLLLSQQWGKLKSSLHDLNEDWDVWTRWYDAILEGLPSPGGEELDIYRMRLGGGVDWSKSPAEVNQLIKQKETEIRSKPMSDGAMFAATYSPLQVPINVRSSRSTAGTGIGQSTIYWPPPLPLTEAEEALKGNVSKTKTTGEELAKYSSPQPTLTSDGKLDVRPNVEFDVLVASQDLPTLPIRQLRLIDVILGDLPQQAPRHLKSSLVHYGEEIKARGINPFLGILKDMAEIIVVASAENDGEWLQPGLRKSFELFSANHIVFIEHFPLDIEREKRFGEIAVNEDSAIGEAFVNPFREVESAVKASIFVTANTVVVMERMRELAEITAYMPPLHGGYLDPRNVVPQPSDHFAVPSVRKRLILQIVGLLSACKSMLSPVAKLVDLFYKFSKLIELFHRYFPHPL